MDDSSGPIPSSVPPVSVGSGPESPTPSGTGLPPNLSAALACFFSIVGGLVFLVIEKRDRFVRFYAMQSIFLGGAAIAMSIAIQIAAAILAHLPVIGWLLVLLLGLVGVAFGLLSFGLWAFTLFKAFTGKEWEIPVLGPLARRQLGRMNPPAV